MIEIIVLGAVILALIGFMAWREYQYQEQVKMLVRAIKAGDVHDLVYAEKSDKKEPEPTLGDEFVPLDQASNELWRKHLDTSQDDEEAVESV